MFVPILTYHKIQDDFDFSITRITPREFERQISYLAACGYASTSITDLVAGSVDTGKRIIITFDDAYESVFKHALPILTKYNFTGTVFVISQFVGRWNQWDYNFFQTRSRHCTWKQLQMLASEGWEIGSHTATHRKLNALSSAELWSELKDSKSTIEEMLGTRVSTISYPFGCFNGRVLRLVEKAGYVGGCTLGYPTNKKGFSPYTLPRRGVYLREPFPLFKVKLQNNFWSHYDDVKQRAITFCSQGSVFLRQLQHGNKIYLD